MEQLEPRLCFASAWQNPSLPLDVDDSGLVTAGDALAVINQISRSGVYELPPTRSSESVFYDTTGDQLLTARDALLVINALGKHNGPLFLLANVPAEHDPNLNGVVTTNEVVLEGRSHPGVELRVANETTGRVDTLATDVHTGDFSVVVPLANGLNTIQFESRDPLGRVVQVSRTVRMGNLVHDWNATALNVVREWNAVSDDPYEGRIVPSEPPRVARNLAMIQTAMFDAINAIEQDFESYLPQSFNVPGLVSPEAAAASAAFHVASTVYSEADELAYWNATLSESLTGIPENQARENGLELGRSIAQALIAERSADGANAASSYQPVDAPGNWDRTLPGYLPPLIPHWRNVIPFVVDDVREFRPAPPPSLDSVEYAQSVDEVMRIGRLNSTDRTDDQTEIAVFWADGAGTYTPPGHWNQIAADVSMSQATDLADTARLFSLLNLALADAGIAAWDAKYEYDFWRPIDAIREARSDGNDATVSDEDWLPLLPNPPFPTYTSGHSTFSGAADAVLTHFFGEDTSFSSEMDGQNAPGQRPLDPSLIVTRHFDSFRHAAEEAGVSRIYGGIHFDFDNIEGLAAGRAVGSAVFSSALRPLDDPNNF